MFLLFCVLIMSQVTVTTTTPPVTVLCSGALLITIDSYTGSHFCGPDNIRSAWCGSATTVDSEEHSEGFCWPHCYAAARTISVLDTCSGICKLCHGSSSGKFLFQSWASYWFLMSCAGVCYGTCFLLSGSHIAAMFTNGGSTTGVLQHCNPLKFTLSKHMCFLVMVCGPWQEYSWVAAPTTASSRETFLLLFSAVPSQSIHMVR